jgi:hypothetical protein
MRRFILLLLSLAACRGNLHASITIELSAGQLLTATGAPVGDGGLIQLLAAPSATAFTAPSAGSFTGGSSGETVVASFGLDSPTTGTAGYFDHIVRLTFSGGLQAGEPLLLRWYPTLTTAATSPGGGTSYGQFRTDAVVDGSDIAWVTPGDGATDSLSFVTSSQGGSEPNSAGEASETTPGGSPAQNPPVISSATSADAEVGKPFSYQIAASDLPTAFKASGLPAGLSVNGGGLISGTPTQAGDFSITLAATNTVGSGTAILALSVQNPVVVFPKITSANAADAVSGQSFSYQIVATEEPSRFGATGLPAGLAVAAVTGVISGVPTQTGVFHISLSATDASGTGTAALTLTVQGAAPPPPPGISAPVITSVLSVDGEVGLPFRYQITASNQPTGFGASPLPAGLEINAATGFISGMPVAAGLHAIALSATNSAGEQTLTLQLKVSAPPLPIVTVAASIPKVTIGRGTVGRFTISLSKVLRKPLIVTYKLKGTAVDGVDYQLLAGTKTIPAGSKKANIKVVPRGDLDGMNEKTVTLLLKPGKDYKVSTMAPAKVEILSGK